jgi:hypothetical protein
MSGTLETLCSEVISNQCVSNQLCLKMSEANLEPADVLVLRTKRRFGTTDY